MHAHVSTSGVRHAVSSSASTTATTLQKWYHFPRMQRLAFGKSVFDGFTLKEGAGGDLWSWDQDAVLNPNAEMFVDADEAEVLHHMTYLSGLCLRQTILGPIGHKLSTDAAFSHQNVPEFSTFWSSTPLTAWLSKRSAKVLMLLLAIGFTYMAQPQDSVRFMSFNGWPTTAMRIAALQVSLDPSDPFQKTRGPMEIDKIMPVVQNDGGMPLGVLPDLISNYTVFRPNDHMFLLRKESLITSAYVQFRGPLHPTKHKYYAFVWMIWYWFKVEGSPTYQGDTRPFDQIVMDDYWQEHHPALECLRSFFLNATYQERIEMATALERGSFADKCNGARLFRYFVEINRGWDDKEHLIQSEFEKGVRMVFGIVMWSLLAFSMWVVWLNVMGGKVKILKGQLSSSFV